MQPRRFCWAKISLEKHHFIYWWAALLSFDRLPPAIAQACHEETLDWPPCQQHRSPMVGCKGHHLSVPWPWEISQPFGFPVRMMGADVSGTTSFQELFVQHFQKQLSLTGFQNTETLVRVSPWSNITVWLCSPATLLLRQPWVPGGPRTTPGDRGGSSVLQSTVFHSWNTMRSFLHWAQQEKRGQENMKQCREEQSLSVRRQARAGLLSPRSQRQDEGWRSEDRVPWRKRIKRRSWEPYISSLKTSHSLCPKKISIEKEND